MEQESLYAFRNCFYNLGIIIPNSPNSLFRFDKELNKEVAIKVIDLEEW